jgi:hypothetical protein
MNPEDRFFVVTYTNGINVRSKSEVEKGSDLGDFDLNHGDVIHAVAVEESSNGTKFHNFDRIYREGAGYDSPFDKFPKYMPSPTGKYWAAEKDKTRVWMTETSNPELSTTKPADIPGIDTYAPSPKLSTTKPADIPGTDSQPPSTKKYVGWRALHRAEGGLDALKHQKKFPPDMPAVIPPAANKSHGAIDMTKDIQYMSFALMQKNNKTITKNLWTKVHDGNRAFTNGQGFNQENDPRRNYVMEQNLSPKIELPKYDKAGRLCAGNFVRGEVRGNKLVCIAGVHGINAKKMPPLDTYDWEKEPMKTFLQTILDNNWYLYALNLYGAGTKKEHVGHFPQGGDGPVVIPFIFEGEIEFDLNWFDKWESDDLPDPLRMYKLE